MAVKIFLITSIFLCSTFAMADETVLPSASIAYDFLNISSGARQTAIGESFSGIADDIYALSWNPGGIAFLIKPEASFMHNQWLADIKKEWVGIAYPLRKFSLAGALTYMNTGEQKEIRSLEQGPTGSFSPTFLSWTIGSGMVYKRKWGFGTTLKYIYENLKLSNYHTGNISFGILYLHDRNTSIGFSLFNIGPSSANHLQPALVNLGVSKRLFEKTLLLAGQIGFRAEHGLEASAGFEYLPLKWVAVRAGYRYFVNGMDLGYLSGVTAGFGIKYDFPGNSSLHLDYALVPYGILGWTHRVSLSIKLPARRNPFPHIETFAKPHLEIRAKEIKSANIQLEVLENSSSIASWKISIIDSKDREVLSHTGKSVPSREWVWDRKGKDGKLVPNSLSLKYRLYTFDEFNEENFQSSLIPLVTEADVKKHWEEVRPSVKINAGTETDLTGKRIANVTFDMEIENPESITEWNLQIVDKDNKIFHEKSAKGGISAQLKWDGIISSGEQLKALPDYFYKVIYTDLQDIKRTVAAPLISQKTLAEQKEFGFKPVFKTDFVPKYDMQGKGVTEAKFVLKENFKISAANWSIQVLNPKGATIATYSGKGSAPKEISIAELIGKNPEDIKDMKYKLELTDQYDTQEIVETSLMEEKIEGTKRPLKIQRRISITVFKFNEADIKPYMFIQLIKAGEMIRAYPRSQIEIAGHTDNIGTMEYNRELSKKRADIVLRYLVEKEGIDANRIIVSGYGFSQPIADNTTEEGRARNRRVEIIITVEE